MQDYVYIFFITLHIKVTKTHAQSEYFHDRDDYCFSFSFISTITTKETLETIEITHYTIFNIISQNLL